VDIQKLVISFISIFYTIVFDMWLQVWLGRPLLRACLQFGGYFIAVNEFAVQIVHLEWFLHCFLLLVTAVTDFN
jgi:hypothetical protein